MMMNIDIEKMDTYYDMMEKGDFENKKGYSRIQTIFSYIKSKIFKTKTILPY